jgi:hypothetical protein
VKTSIIALAVLVFLVTPAMANQCPQLIKQINDAVDSRMAADDTAGSTARKLAKEAEALHKEGKHAEAVQKAEEAAKVIHLKLQMK